MKVTFKLEPFPTGRWDAPDTKEVAALWKRFSELFADWKPKRRGAKPSHGAYREHTFEADAGDARLEKLVAQFRKEIEKTKKAGGHVEFDMTPAEIKRARYVEFGARRLDDPADERAECANRYPVLCKTCGSPDLSKVPSPYWVSREVRKRPKDDLFSPQEALLIARPVALEVLKAAVGDEIEVGLATVVGEEKKKLAEQDQLWWVRPLHAIGPTSVWYVESRCPKCDRPVHAHYNPKERVPRGRQVSDYRQRVPDYGGHGASIVRIDEFAGNVNKDGSIGFYSSLAVSGTLAAHLKAMKVKGGGFNPGRTTAVCILSQKADEPALVEKPRAFAKPGEATLERLTPKPAPVPVVDPAKVRKDVESSWKRIDKWLKANAPDMLAALAPGASDAQIADVEQKLKVTFPEDVRASWRVHDGGEDIGLLPSSEAGDMAYSLLSLKEMARDFKSMRAWRDMGWENGWLPIATNGGGDYQCVDLIGDDGDPATRGRVIEFQHEVSDYEPVAASLAERLRELAAGLESGKYRVDEDNGIERAGRE